MLTPSAVRLKNVLESTHKAPIPKTTTSLVLCFSPIFKFRISGIGTMKMKRSTKTFQAPVR